jgi:hypothetical protein
MHWSPDGAQTMLDIVLSDQWQDLYRSQEQHTSGLIPGQRVA